MQELDSNSLADAQAFSFDLDEKTKQLELIADWRAELRYKFADAVNDVWGPPPDLNELRCEVERYKLACKGVRA